MDVQATALLVVLIAIVAMGLVAVVRAFSTVRRREPSKPAGETRAPKEAANTVAADTTPARAPAYTKIFVSYRREDSPYVAGRVYESLVNRFGADSVFRDVDSFPLGVDFRKSIDHAVSDATIVLVIVGREWLGAGLATQRRIDNSTDFVRIEIAAALRRGIPVVPLLVDGATMPAAETLPEEIRDFAYRNAVPIRPDPDFGNDVDRLVRGITNLQSFES
jgi:hypothetical protein